MNLKEIVVPEDINYVAAFLTLRCMYKCAYCINHHGELDAKRMMSGSNWILGLNRFKLRSDLPITFQGGEPTTHPDFYRIINGIRSDSHIDLLTNLQVDTDVFMKYIKPERLRREAKYASIRVSYHPSQTTWDDFIERILVLQNNGYHIGVFEIANPDNIDELESRKATAIAMGIDWRLKEFLGPWKGKTYGTFRYEGAVEGNTIKVCDCATSEILISPDGYIFRCHSDLYANRFPIAHIFDPDLPNIDFTQFRPCKVFGKCNSCDIKVKNNRFQEWGHSSVTIKNIKEN